MDLLANAMLDLASSGKNIILSTHNMERAEKLCSSVVIMNHGKIVLSGNLSDLKTTIGTQRVAVEFDGNLNKESLSTITRSISSFPHSTEIELADGYDSATLLRKLIDQVAIRKFEVISPSLHKIYVDLVGEAEYA
jgi:ABC-2 type transport system ATP-binding protein